MLPTTSRARPGERDRSAAATPAAERSFRPDVQGLRAVAVGMVVFYHLYPSALPGGYVGVDVFFVISGFLITGHLARTFARTGRVGLLDFWGRRARRLIPAAALVLTVTWLLARAVLPDTQLPATAEQVRASAWYFQNWTLAHDAVSYLKSDQAPSPVQHFWSLSVEEQFYLVWPLLFLVAGLLALLILRVRPSLAQARSSIGRTVMFTIAMGVLVASLGYSVRLTDANPSAAYFVTTTRMWELAFGGALALLSPWAAQRLGRAGLLGWVGLVMVLSSAFVITARSPFPGSVALLPVGGAVLLIACGSRAGRLGPWPVTSVRPMVFIGDISYSLYLWHWPVIVLWKAYSGHRIGVISGPVLAGVAVLLAWLTKVFVEDRVRLAPFIARHTGRSLATALLAMVPVVLVSQYLWAQPAKFTGVLDARHPGAAVLAGDVRTVPKAAAVPPLTQAADDGSAYASGPRGCQAVQLSKVPAPCVYGDTVHPTKTVALVGDSVAGQWFTAVNDIAIRHHWRLVLDLHSLCPWTATMLNYPVTNAPYRTCHSWGVTVLDDLLTKIKPAVVITSERPAVGTADHHPPDQTSFARIGRGMATYWKRLAQHGIPVVALRESPEMGQNIPDCLSARGATVASCSVARSSALIDHSPLQVATAASAATATLVDMSSDICGPHLCQPIIGNVVVYRDSHHLTKTYTKTLTPYLERALLKVPALRS